MIEIPFMYYEIGMCAVNLNVLTICVKLTAVLCCVLPARFQRILVCGLGSLRGNKAFQRHSEQPYPLLFPSASWG